MKEKKQEAEIIINGEIRRVEVTDELRKIFEFDYLKVWKPKNREKYRFITDEGQIDYDFWDNDETDIFRWETGNCKQTEAECEFKREKEKVETELRNFAKEHNEPIDWKDDDQPKYFICWAIFENEITTDKIFYYKHKDIYFSSEKIAEAAVKAIGEDRVKKYYLEVE